MAETEGGGSAYVAGAERVRDAAKWLLGAFGAIATVLVAGSQLSSIGALDDGKRLVVAVVAAVVALVGLAAASWLVVDIMLPSAALLPEIAANDALKQKIDLLPELLQGNHSVDNLQRDYELALELRLEAVRKNYSMPPEASDDEVKAAGNLVVVLGQAVQAVEGYAAYKNLDSKLRDNRRLPLFGLAGLVAMAIIVFAWASNPPEKPKPEEAATSLAGLRLDGVSLRGAELAKANLVGISLSGADLRGANLSSTDLRNADLSEADLRGADLSGADMSNTDLTDAQTSGSLLSDVVWSNTSCPDGSQSTDDPEKTCLGHDI